VPNYSPSHYFTQAHRSRIIVKAILKLTLDMFFCRLYLTLLSNPKLHKWYKAYVLYKHLSQSSVLLLGWTA